MTEQQSADLRQAMDAISAELSKLSTPHQLAVLGRLLGSAACAEGAEGRAPEKFTAHSRLGQAIAAAYGVVAQHFRGID